MFFVVILRKDHLQNNHDLLSKSPGKPTIVIRLRGKSRMVIYKTEDPVSRYNFCKNYLWKPTPYHLSRKEKMLETVREVRCQTVRPEKIGLLCST
jgi:hypothetical protein